jgi:hypothetical protein
MGRLNAAGRLTARALLMAARDTPMLEPVASTVCVVAGARNFASGGLLRMRPSFSASSWRSAALSSTAAVSVQQAWACALVPETTESAAVRISGAARDAWRCNEGLKGEPGGQAGRELLANGRTADHGSPGSLGCASPAHASGPLSQLIGRVRAAKGRRVCCVRQHPRALELARPCPYPPRSFSS